MNKPLKPTDLASLQSAHAPLRPDFKKQLKQSFTERSEVPHGFLFVNALFMKRFSMISLSALTILALVVAFYPSSLPSLSPESILAEAEASYETPISGIIHETVTVKSDGKGGPTTDEYWYDTSGNYYHIWYNGLTQEFINGYLYRVNEDNTADFYSYFTTEGEEVYVSLNKDGRFQGAATYEPNNLTCYQVVEADDVHYEAKILNIDANHPEETNGMGEIRQDLRVSSGEQLESLSNIDAKGTTSDEAKKIIQSLKESPDLQFEEKEEAGKKYYVFTNHVVKEAMDYDFTFIYTLDAESYQIIKKEILQKGEKQGEVHYEHEVLDPSLAESVYDPTKYNLTGSSVTRTVEELTQPDSGCYNDLNEKLPEGETSKILEQIPEEIRTEFLSKDFPQYPLE